MSATIPSTSPTIRTGPVSTTIPSITAIGMGIGEAVGVRVRVGDGDTEVGVLAGVGVGEEDIGVARLDGVWELGDLVGSSITAATRAIGTRITFRVTAAFMTTRNRFLWITAERMSPRMTDLRILQDPCSITRWPHSNREIMPQHWTS